VYYAISWTDKFDILKASGLTIYRHLESNLSIKPLFYQTKPLVLPTALWQNQCATLLDYSIIGPSPLPYHLSFMVGLVDEVPSSMVPEPRSWVQFPPVTQFSVAHIPPSLAFVGLVGTAALERE
jgi:hypothetical protein